MKNAKWEGFGLSSYTATPPRHTETDTCGEAPRLVPDYVPLFDDGDRITRLVLEKDKFGTLESGLDYLTIFAHFHSLDQLSCALSEILEVEHPSFSDKSWSPGDGAKKYDFRLEHPVAFGGYYYDDFHSLFYACLRLPGKFWDALTLCQQFEKIQSCYSSGFRQCSRIDPKIDDYSFQIIPYKEIAQEAKKGNFFGAKKYRPFREYDDGGLDKLGEYLGSRNSSYFQRVYVHTFGEDKYHSMRMELEVKRKKAQLVYEVLAKADPTDVLSWDEIVQDEFVQFDVTNRKFTKLEISDEGLENWGKLIAQIVVGAFDFRDKSVADSRRDSPRFNWWQNFIDSIGGFLRVRLNPEPPSLPKTFRWILRQWLPTLAQFKYGLGVDGFKNLMQTLAEEGNRKLNNYHLANIDYLMRNPDIILDFRDSEYAF